MDGSKKNKRQRANGLGTVSFDKARGNWIARVQVGFSPDGRPRYAKRRAATKTEAEKALHELHALNKTGKLAPASKLTLGQFLDHWLTMLPTHLSPNTKRSYEGTVRNHLKPHLGGRPLSKVTAGEIEAMYRRLEDAGLSRIPSYAHRVLCIAFKEAMRTDQIAINPMEKVKAPRVSREREENHQSREETAKLLSHLQTVQGDPINALMFVGIETGARLSEISGIAWEDVDFEEGCVQIRWQLARGAGKEWERRPLKTFKSRRVRFLSEEALHALKEERARQAVLGFANPLGLALLNAEGRPWEHSHANKKIRETCVAAGVRPFPSHTLFRHTLATHLLKGGVPMHDVSRELGHSSISLTANLYGHHEIEASKRAAKARRQYLQGGR